MATASDGDDRPAGNAQIHPVPPASSSAIAPLACLTPMRALPLGGAFDAGNDRPGSPPSFNE